jgi:hypothetical protein
MTAFTELWNLDPHLRLELSHHRSEANGSHKLRYKTLDGKLFEAEGSDERLESISKCLLEEVREHLRFIEANHVIEHKLWNDLNYWMRVNCLANEIVFEVTDKTSSGTNEIESYSAVGTLKIGEREFSRTFFHWDESKMKKKLISVAHEEIYGF